MTGSHCVPGLASERPCLGGSQSRAGQTELDAPSAHGHRGGRRRSAPRPSPPLAACAPCPSPFRGARLEPCACTCVRACRCTRVCKHVVGRVGTPTCSACPRACLSHTCARAVLDRGGTGDTPSALLEATTRPGGVGGKKGSEGDRHGQSWGQGAPRRPIPGPQPAAHAVACLRLSPAGRIRRPHSPLPAGTRSPARHPVGERGAPRVFSVVRGQVTRHHRLPELLSCSPFWGRGPGRPQAAAPPARWGSAAVLLTELTFRRSLGPRHWLRAGGSASEGCCDCTARTLGPPAGSPPTSLRASFPFGEDILRTSPENPKSR